MKTWEKEFDKELGKIMTGPYGSVIPFKETNLYKYVKEWMAKHLSRAVAKERTQLLKWFHQELIKIIENTAYDADYSDTEKLRKLVEKELK